MAYSKPNSDRRLEGEEGAGAHQEGPNSVQAGQTQRRAGAAPEQAPKTGRSTRQGNKRSTDGGPNNVADEEPGPHDDDGLPENARRRVPS
jgi:hypothetical protein